jgi:hypothetical protein
MRTVITGLLIIFVLMADQAFTAEQTVPTAQRARGGNQAMLIHFDRGRLTVKLREAPIKTVLEEIGRRAGIEIAFPGSLTENISMEFDNLPLEEGLRRLLKGKNSAFTYLAGDAQQPAKLALVLVLPKPGEGGIAVPRGMPEKKSDDGAKQKKVMKEMRNTEEKSLDEVLQIFSQQGADLEDADIKKLIREFYNALGEIKEINDSEEMMQLEEILKNLSQGGIDLKKKESDAFKIKREVAQ